jgi:hypothetical protein
VPPDASPPDESRLFVDERGFFRSSRLGPAKQDPLPGYEVVPGPLWSPDEARVELHRFLDALADGRKVDDRADPLEHAQVNGLFLLFGPAVEARFSVVLSRLPDDMADQWIEALAGGRASDAFGPVTEDEAILEARVDAELKAGRVRRFRTIASVVAGLVLVVGAVIVFWPHEGRPAAGTIRFDDNVQSGPGSGPRTGDAPVADKSLVARLDLPIALKAGDGPPADRIVTSVPPADLPAAPGAIAATLFRYAGRGQVVLVGPKGWTASACLQVSVVSSNERPFDTALYRQPATACPSTVSGRVANIGCQSDTVLMLDLEIPEGTVNLAEGGSGSVAGVRVLLHGKKPGYETLYLRGRIQVGSGKEVTVPTFGGAAGTTVGFDLSPPSGDVLTGTCVLR